MTPPNKSRRKQPSKSAEELYKVADIQSFIEKERRHDELARLQEIRSQNNVWSRTVLVCGLLNVLFIILAIIGAYL